MKIAVVSGGHVPSSWAHSINMVKHAQGFMDLGHEVEFFSPLGYFEKKNLKNLKSIHDYYGVDKSLKINLIKERPLFYYKEFSVVFRKLFSLIRRLGIEHLLFPFSISEKIAKIIKNEKFDLVYARNVSITYYFKKYQIPFVLEVHGFNISGELKKRLLMSREIFFRQLVTVSDALRKIYLKIGVPNKKITVLEDCVDLKKYNAVSNNKSLLRKKHNLPKDKKIITYAGGIDKNRGLEDICYCAKKNPNHLFLIIGEANSYYRKLFLRISNIKYLGFVENKLIPSFLKLSDILLAPYSKKIDIAKVISPIKLFEYMAARVPIIISDLPRIKEIVDESEVSFFHSDNSKSLNKIINKVLFENDRRRIDKAYKKVKKFTYVNRCQEILNRS